MLETALEPSYNFQKSFITAMDTEVDKRHGKWFNPPDYISRFMSLGKTLQKSYLNTALFGKVYRTIFQSKRRHLQNRGYYVHTKFLKYIFKYIFTYIYMFVMK